MTASGGTDAIACTAFEPIRWSKKGTDETIRRATEEMSQNKNSKSPNGTVLEFDDSDMEPSIGRPDMINQKRAWKIGPNEPSGLGTVDLEEG